MIPCRRGWWPGRVTALAAVLAVPASVPMAAQQIRVTGTTSVRYLDLRPLVADSVLVESTRGTGLIRRTLDGRVVQCVEGQRWCHLSAAGDAVAAVPLLQDLEVSAWGFGRGIRAYALLRGRTVGGGGEVAWSRASDAFDPLAAWVEVDREGVRVRGGRQWMSSGLGFYNYDGASVLLRAPVALTVELFGGRSLVRGANESRTGDALAPLEAFAPAEEDLLVGGRITWRPGPSTSLAAHYQREVRRDRAGLYAERATLDGGWRGGRWAVTGTVEVDVAQRDLSELRLQADARLGSGVGASVSGRRHRPWFEAWTIWGAFDPVGFDEATGRLWWQPTGRPLALEVGGAWRRYPETHASTTFGTFRDTGWRLNAAGRWSPTAQWHVDGRLATDIGFGASSSDGGLRIERRLGVGRWFALSATAFDRLYEFRVAEGTVWGVGADGGFRLGPRASVRADLAGYRHAGSDRPGPDWSQLRASLLFRWTVGAEPGTPAGGVP